MCKNLKSCTNVISESFQLHFLLMFIRSKLITVNVLSVSGEYTGQLIC